MHSKKNKPVSPPARPVEATAEIPGESVPSENTPEIRPKNAPVEYADDLAGLFRATTALNLREQPDGDVLTILMPGHMVRGEGGYTRTETGEWFYVETDVAGAHFAGYCMSRFLERV